MPANPPTSHPLPKSLLLSFRLSLLLFKPKLYRTLFHGFTYPDPILPTSGMLPATFSAAPPTPPSPPRAPMLPSISIPAADVGAAALLVRSPTGPPVEIGLPLNMATSPMGGVVGGVTRSELAVVFSVVAVVVVTIVADGVGSDSISSAPTLCGEPSGCGSGISGRIMLAGSGGRSSTAWVSMGESAEEVGVRVFEMAEDGDVDDAQPKSH